MNNPTSPLKAVRAKCLDCSGGSAKEVRECDISTCALWPFRFGKNPNRKPRKLTEQQRKNIADRLAEGRASKDRLADEKTNKEKGYE